MIIILFYYTGAHGILFAFSLSDSESFASIENWMSSVEQFAREKVVRFIVGLKNDLTGSRTVQYETAEAFAQKHNMTYMVQIGSITIPIIFL